MLNAPFSRAEYYAAALLLTVPLAGAQATYQATSLATNAPAGQPLSTRVVDYSIDAHIDMVKKALDASETLTYKNLTGSH